MKKNTENRYRIRANKGTETSKQTQWHINSCSNKNLQNFSGAQTDELTLALIMLCSTCHLNFQSFIWEKIFKMLSGAYKSIIHQSYWLMIQLNISIWYKTCEMPKALYLKLFSALFQSFQLVMGVQISQVVTLFSSLSSNAL